MLLRTRLTLFLSIAFVIILVLLIGASDQRDDSETSHYANVAIAGQSALWKVLLRSEMDSLNADADRLLDALGPQSNAAPPALRQAMVSMMAIASGRIQSSDIVQLIGPHGELLYSNAGGGEPRPLLDVQALDEISTAGLRFSGLSQDNPNRFVVISATPVAVAGKTVAVLAVARDAGTLVSRFAADYGAATYLISLRGRMITGSDRQLWSDTHPSVPRRRAEMSTVEGKTRLLLVTSVPVHDLTGGNVGILVSLRDSSETLGDVRTVEQIGMIVVGLFLLLTLGWLFFYLRRSFRPLEGAIGVLKALSRGDTAVAIEETGDGEIRAIAETVSVFRQNAIALEQTQMETERQRRRQERLIRRQLEALARTLETDGRKAVMEDLRAIVDNQRTLPAADAATARMPAAASGGGAADDGNGQLGLLAALLQRMSARIAEQHRRLRELVDELRESIVTRAKLAGLQQELEIARDLQLSILPRSSPQTRLADVFGRMMPAKEIGGDFYDYFLLGDNKLALVVADVSGKGVPAAMFMAITRTLLKATTLFSEKPSACIEMLNDVLSAENEQMMFVTIFFGVLDLESGDLTYVNAGHNPPWLMRHGAAPQMLPATGGMAVAVMGEIPYREASVRLGPGDLLVLYTDGVTEAFDSSENAYGDDRLGHLIAALPPTMNAAAITAAVFEDVHHFERGATQADDITCVALRYAGPSQTPHQS